MLYLSRNPGLILKLGKQNPAIEINLVHVTLEREILSFLKGQTVSCMRLWIQKNANLHLAPKQSQQQHAILHSVQKLMCTMLDRPN